MKTAATGPLTDATLGYIFVFVHDLAVMMHFYREVLGLQLLYGAEGEFAFFQLGVEGPQLALYPGRDSPGNTAPHWFIVLNVRSIEAAVDDLKAKGVPVGAIEPVPYGRAVQLVDPEGNSLELHEPAVEAGS
jgi:predicted enzyme related to lactoylglutathione lyase